MSPISKSDEALYAEAAAEWQAEHDAGVEHLCSLGEKLMTEAGGQKPEPSVDVVATCPVLQSIDFAAMRTADILKAYVVAGVVPVHPQTVADFGFDRTVTQADQFQLLDVYRHLMVTTLNVPSADVHAWVGESKEVLLKNVQAKLRAALEAGATAPEEMNRLKDTFRWLTRNRYIWDASYAHSETRAYMDAAAAKPINTKADMLEQVKLMAEGMAKVAMGKEARERRGEVGVAADDSAETSVHRMKGPGGRTFLPVMFCPGMDLKGFAEEIKAQQVGEMVARKKAAMEQEK
ncbi:hypothetical protein CGLO_16060 [Colletotrichum gloeosporioides Cg-14]|uniref:Uncharacterized protein n=1 Tax=Colletotrichum gloeosporioides (strain Cg-14) TaxID=1237896 RepID=T0LA72_COLGC|nr:hypothetical protein CGLO_16060 [Colletotrichum gloeosporioides Cg-14]